MDIEDLCDKFASVPVVLIDPKNTINLINEKVYDAKELTKYADYDYKYKHYKEAEQYLNK